MMSTRICRLFGIALAAGAFAGCASREDVSALLAVKGHANASPWVAADGGFVAVAWGATLDRRTDVYLAVSRDAGRSFGTPVRVNTVVGEARLGGELPPRVALATRQGGDPTIIVLWTARGERLEVKTATSSDGGRTFGTEQALQGPAAAGDRGWPSLAMDGSGKAHAIWLDHRGLAGDKSAGHAHGQHGQAKPHDGVAMAQKSSLFYAPASSPSEQELAKGVCYCCKTALVSAPDGALHAAWRHVYEGNIRDIAFTTSRDGGTSFSEPVRVSDDRWMLDGCPDDGPALAADRRGTIHIVWPTVIGGAKPEGALFYASTTDGRTFTERVRVPTLGSIKPSHPQIAVGADGRIAVAWDESMGEGRRVSAVRSLSIGAKGAVAFGDAIRIGPDAQAIYPVLASTDRGFIAVSATGGDASVVRAQLLRVP